MKDIRKIQFRQYEPLFRYLEDRRDEGDIALTFAEVEDIIGATLPERARTDGRVWWTVIATRVQARAWLAAGRHPRLDPDSPDVVTFVRSDRLADGDADRRRRTTQMELNYARVKLGSSIDGIDWDRELKAGWWQKHTVYLVHFKEAGVYKVGFTRSDTPRLAKMIASGGEIVDTIEVSNHWAAVVVEHVVLQSVDSHRVEPPLWIAQHLGATEFWSDGFDVGSLGWVLDLLYQDRQLPLWDATYRDIEEIWP